MKRSNLKRVIANIYEIVLDIKLCLLHVNILSIRGML